ncbi:MAG: hypothetical protein FVQ80_13855 [Planctomycetes bacterium]|nr:hypothetical protein [Planctomycetota bacterium]
MSNTIIDRIRRLLQTARSAADSLYSTLGELEEDQGTFTEDECAADDLIETWEFPRAYSSYEQFERK